MEFDFKKLTKSSEKIDILKLGLQKEGIETTKSIAQSMIAMEEVKNLEDPHNEILLKTCKSLLRYGLM